MTSISIITICYNNLAELLKTCRSVDLQLKEPCQHIIIDGSTNNEIAVEFSKIMHPPYRELLSGPDSGIADAFNKGILRANGDIVMMLNSGDEFYDETVLGNVTDMFVNQPGISWLHGKYQLTRSKRSVIIGKPFAQNKLYRGMRSVSHQSMFVKRVLHEKYGLYDTKEKIAMDYDFLCRIAGEPFAFLSKPLITFAPGGTSSIHYLQSLKDAKRIYSRYFKSSVLLPFWQFRLKVLYFLLKSPLGNLLYKIKLKLKMENM